MRPSLLPFALVLIGVAVTPRAVRPQGTLAWDSVGAILQAPAVPASGYVRYNLPRRDITLRVGGLVVSQSLGLVAWTGFVGEPGDATMMGDLVVLPSELKAVLAELSRQNIDVNAIHNHLAGEEPNIRNVHFHAMGSATDLARRLDRVLALTATPRPVSAQAARPATFDTAAVFRAMGASGRGQGDVAQVTYMLIPVGITMHGHPVDASLSLRSPVSIQFVDSVRAVATGDFAVLGERVDALLDALAANDITATAVHSHLVGEQPTVYFIHFWADGRPSDVLRGLKAAAEAGRAR
jgi:hypothetical protein